MRAKHTPLIHEKTLQNLGEPLIPCTVFPNVDCRDPFCSPCPYIWLQTGLLCPWIDWILHTVLNCAFNWTQLHEWYQSPLKPPQAPFWPSVVKVGWFKHLTIWSPAAVSARKDSVLQLMRVALQSYSSQRLFPIFTFLSHEWLFSLSFHFHLGMMRSTG